MFLDSLKSIVLSVRHKLPSLLFFLHNVEKEYDWGTMGLEGSRPLEAGLCLATINGSILARTHHRVPSS